MKKSVAFRTIGRSIILLIAILPVLIFGSCQKEDSVILNAEVVTEADSPQLKSADVSDYLLELIQSIESMVEDGILTSGNANALIVKINNASKSLAKGNSNAFDGQLASVINQVESYIEQGIVSMEEGEILIDKAETGAILSKGSFIDERDGNEYSVVKIGDQIWMAENLAYLPSVSPLLDESITNPYYYVYGYNGSNVTDAKATNNYETYSVLYNWPAALKACPSGWHLPTNDEWITLEEFLASNGYNYDGSVGGGSAKIAKSLASTNGWETSTEPGAVGNNQSDNNTSGFNAFPGGCRYDLANGGYFHLGTRSYWWSSTELFNDNYKDFKFAYNRFLDYRSSSVQINILASPSFGYSIRCLKD